MTRLIFYPCAFFEKKDYELIGLIRTFVDDTIGTVSEEFAIKEETKYSKFDSKLRVGIFLLFPGGSIITADNGNSSFMQQDNSNTCSETSNWLVSLGLQFR